MPSAQTFLSLEQIFNMFTPTDLVGTIQPTLGDTNIGNTLNNTDNSVMRLLSLLENAGRGVLSITDFATAAAALQINPSGNSAVSADLSKFIEIWSDTMAPGGSQGQSAPTPTGTTLPITSLTNILGADYVPPAMTSRPTPTVASVILSRSPFFHPGLANTRKAEIFLNFMPSVVLSQLVPYMQVDFQFARPPAGKLAQLSQLKLLLGAVDTTSLSPTNLALMQGHQMTGTSTQSVGSSTANVPLELDYAGMELFTSPVTLTNPQPNGAVGSAGLRYTDVLDPYRPFASLEHVTVTHADKNDVHKVRTASLTLKVHDRSRLSEIADLIRPAVAASSVTVWLTYGWRAPVRGDQTLNPYFAYVNNNLMVREAYQVKNVSYGFDPLGQVTITLALATQAVTRIRELQICDSGQDGAYTAKRIHDLVELISQYRVQLGLDKPVGTNKEIRAFQLLDPGTKGVFPQFDAQQVKTKIDTLQDQLNSSGGDPSAINGLITALQTLYQPSAAAPSKFDLKGQLQSSTAQTTAALFAAASDGNDPFLPSAANSKGPPAIGATCDQQKTSKTLVSFGKIMSVFMLRNLISMTEIDETQLFMYNFNEHCGDISSCNLAEFPCDFAKFKTAYTDQVKTTNGENMLLVTFVNMLINSCVHDVNSFAYRNASNSSAVPVSPTPASTTQNTPGNYESQASQNGVVAGTFHMPEIEWDVEVSHRRVSAEGQPDVLQELSFLPAGTAASATTPTSTIKGMQSYASTKILRLHFYDKNINMNQVATQLIRNASKTGFINSPNPNAQPPSGTPPVNDPSSAIPNSMTNVNATQAGGKLTLTPDPSTGSTTFDPTAITSNQQLKDLISKCVPTIRFGCNGTTVKSATVTTALNPDVGASLMVSINTTKNSAGANGTDEHGLPFTVIPGNLSLNTLGNPLARNQQRYFVDFQTGTQLDNVYICHEVVHSFSPGKFETSWKMIWWDGYKRFSSPGVDINAATSVSPAGASTGGSTPAAGAGTTSAAPSAPASTG